MYYDDEARRFNFLSGLLLGALLGTGLGLLVGPQKRIGRSPRRIRDSTAAARRRSVAGVEDARERAQRAAESALARLGGAIEGARRS